MPDNDRQDDQHGKLKPSDQTHARPVHDLLWAVLIIIAALASIQIDPQHGADNAGLIFVIGMSLLFIKCLRDAIQTAGQGRAAQRPETLHTWPPTLPNQWPPIPPVTLTLPSAPRMTILLQLVSPMLLAMLLLTFMRSYGQISTANFIPNDVASIHAQWIYLATGIGVIAYYGYGYIDPFLGCFIMMPISRRVLIRLSVRALHSPCRFSWLHG